MLLLLSLTPEGDAAHALRATGATTHVQQAIHRHPHHYCLLAHGNELLQALGAAAPRRVTLDASSNAFHGRALVITTNNCIKQETRKCSIDIKRRKCIEDMQSYTIRSSLCGPSHTNENYPHEYIVLTWLLFNPQCV